VQGIAKHLQGLRCNDRGLKESSFESLVDTSVLRRLLSSPCAGSLGSFMDASVLRRCLSSADAVSRERSSVGRRA
jgi:hypothetical protein